MKRIIFCGLFLLALLPLLTRAATSSDYINNSTVFNPQIDATNVINQNLGVINTSTQLRFTPTNARNYTNYGVFNGGVGFEFDTAPSASPGQRLMANSFFNGPPLANGGGTVGASLWLWVIATNITSSGNLAVSASGEIKLIGTNVNLSRSLIEALPIAGSGSSQDTNLFFPELGVYDNYWGQTNMTLFLASLYDNTNATTPAHNVSVGGPPFLTSFSVHAPYPLGYGYSNLVDPNANLKGFNLTLTNFGSTTNPILTHTVFVVSNALLQSVFIGTNLIDSQSVRVRFVTRTDTNDFKTVVVEFASMTTNAATGATNVSTVYFSDSLGSDPVRGLRVNASYGTFRPVNYSVSRLAPVLFTPLSPDVQAENHDPSSSDIYNSSYFTNKITGAAYAGYSATIDNVASRPLIGDPVTNLPGRIIINADILDMTKTRIRGEGLVTIQARHLVGSSNAVVDAQNLSYSLGSTNGNLVVQDLIKSTVSRIGGDLRAWSAVWFNTYPLVSMNFDINTNVMPPLFTTLVLVTNNIPFAEHMLILDASTLNFHEAVPVTVYSLVLHSTNGSASIILNDRTTIYKTLLFDGRRLTLNTNLNIGQGTLQDWNAAVAPNVLFFTNNGSLFIAGQGHFGDDRPPYDTFVDHGLISASALTINTTNLLFNLNVELTSGQMTLFARTGTVFNAVLNSGGDIVENIKSLIITNSAFLAGGRLVFNSTNSLLTGTVTNGSNLSLNFLRVGGGFTLASKPAISDLMATHIESDIPDFAEIDHFWSGTDMGPVKAGFTNNAALGKLTLVNSETDPFFQPLIYFAPTGPSNALYVDDLDLSQLAGTTNVLGFDPNFIIYYAFSEGVPADVLNHCCNDHLRWVTNFTGPYSSTNVIRDGTNLFPVNRGLREAMTIDSNGIGGPNGTDSTPFDGVPLSSILKIKQTSSGQQQQQAAASSFDISWAALAGGIYQVQYSTNLPPTWLPLLKYTNNGDVQTVTITDKPPAGTPRRYYRVGTITTP